MPRRPFILLGPLLMLLSCAAALAQDGGAAPAHTPSGVADMIRDLGPFGALAWGAYLLGGAAKGLGDVLRQVMAEGVPLRVQLSEKDREALEALAAARRAGGPR